MTAKTLVLAFSGFCLCTAISAPLSAKEIPIIPAKDVQAGCKKVGGTFFPPSKDNGSYGCVAGNGTITYCGGSTKQQKKSCTQAAARSAADKQQLGERSSRFATTMAPASAK